MIGRRTSASVAALLATGLLTAAPTDAARAEAKTPPPPSPAVPLDEPVDVAELLRLARIQQTLNARVYRQYTFRQTTRVETLDRDGEVERTETKVYRVVPEASGTERHLLEVDGDEPPPRLLRKQEKRNRKLKKRWAKIRRKRERAAEERRAEQAARSEPRERTKEAAPPAPARREAPAAEAEGTPESHRPTGSGPAPDAGAPVESTESAAQTRSTEPPGPAGPPSAPRATPVPRRLTGARARAAGGVDAFVPDDIPPCSADDPTEAVRPAPRGEPRTARQPPGRPAEETRRARESTGDYSLFELLSLTEHDYVGTCLWDDRIVHVVTFEPAPDFDPLNPVERVVSAMEGTILIDAAELQVVRAEGVTVAPIKWGAGLVALREAAVVFETAKVNDEVWLPSLDEFEFDSRVLFDRDRQRVTNYYDEYRKHVVTSTDEVVGVVE